MKTYILTPTYGKSLLSTIALPTKGGGVSIVCAFFPLKFITEAHPSLPFSPLTGHTVPRELHFRHYCQVPLTLFFLPFYLQQLIRVPLPFSLLDDVSASLVKPFHFSEEEPAPKLFILSFFFCGPHLLEIEGLVCQNENSSLQIISQGLRFEPINGRMANNLPFLTAASWTMLRCFDNIIREQRREINILT